MLREWSFNSNRGVRKISSTTHKTITTLFICAKNQPSLNHIQNKFKCLVSDYLIVVLDGQNNLVIDSHDNYNPFPFAHVQKFNPLPKFIFHIQKFNSFS